jgi:hypothetical protein
MRKAIILIGASLIFFIGIAGQSSARRIHCWDFIQNYVCDIEEDINEDGKCNARDCETEEQCYAVPQTGQTICYDTNGNIIDCAGTGQDGEYQYGTPWPEPRFTDNLDGTVTDHLTGLVWLQNAWCFEQRNWAGALSDANGLASGSCGLTDGSAEGDWHLPNVRELYSLIDFETGMLPVDAPFTPARTYYWTSTTTRWGGCAETRGLYCGHGGFWLGA